MQARGGNLKGRYGGREGIDGTGRCTGMGGRRKAVEDIIGL